MKNTVSFVVFLVLTFFYCAAAQAGQRPPYNLDLSGSIDRPPGDSISANVNIGIGRTIITSLSLNRSGNLKGDLRLSVAFSDSYSYSKTETGPLEFPFLNPDTLILETKYRKTDTTVLSNQPVLRGRLTLDIKAGKKLMPSVSISCNSAQTVNKTAVNTYQDDSGSDGPWNLIDTSETGGSDTKSSVNINAGFTYLINDKLEFSFATDLPKDEDTFGTRNAALKYLWREDVALKLDLTTSASAKTDFRTILFGIECYF